MKAIDPEGARSKNAEAFDRLSKKIKEREALDPAYAEQRRLLLNARQVTRTQGLSAEERRARNRRSNLKVFGISEDEYQLLLDNQGGVCAICKQPETRTNQFGVMSLSVDHCHKTGIVRGLLCANCNRAIGLLQDDLERVRAAAAYLEPHAK